MNLASFHHLIIEKHKNKRVKIKRLEFKSMNLIERNVLGKTQSEFKLKLKLKLKLKSNKKYIKNF